MIRRPNPIVNHTAPGRRPVDFSRSAISRYIQLATLFHRRIESGQWPVGEQIPTVEELAGECGVARATIRQALGILESEKLIERFRAKGTFVRRRPTEELWCEVPTDWSGLLRSRDSARIELLGDKPNVQLRDVPHRIGSLAAAYRHLSRRHWRDESPFLLAEVFIAETLRSRISDEDIASKTALRLIHDVPGLEIVEARQTLTIGTADVETAEALMMPINAPIALVHRRAVDRDGVLVLIADGTYRGDVVRFDIRLR
jgi:GntR family transcriptional regulator